jgi:acetyl esterase/lipase
MKLRLMLVCLAAATGGALVASPGLSQEPRTQMYREAGGQQLQAHVFFPVVVDAGEGNAAVLLFHGGGWSVGSPEWTFDAARRFASHGMVAIAVEYRLSSQEVTPIDALADACAAFRWADDQAEDLHIDRDRIAGYGVSAGGHLVAATATIGCPPDGQVDARLRPDALLLWSPALDLAHDGWFHRLLQDRGTSAEYSPVEHVGPSTPPTSIVIGEKDTLTPLSGSRAFCQRLVEQGPVCQVNSYPGVGHLLTRNLANQESDFDPDPEMVADGIERHLQFLRELGFIRDR